MICECVSRRGDLLTPKNSKQNQIDSWALFKSLHWNFSPQGRESPGLAVWVQRVHSMVIRLSKTADRQCHKLNSTCSEILVDSHIIVGESRKASIKSYLLIAVSNSPELSLSMQALTFKWEHVMQLFSSGENKYIIYFFWQRRGL